MVLNPRAFEETRNGRQQTTDGLWLHRGQLMVKTGPVELPDGSIGNAELGADTARANLLTNGGFEIWQRGNGPFTAAGAYFADRWYIGTVNAGDTFSISRSTGATTDKSFANANVTYTRSTGGSNLQQHMGAANGDSTPQLIGRTLSFSVRVNTSVASAIAAGIYDDVNGFRWGNYHSGAGGYETLTMTAPVAPTAVQVRVGIKFDQTAFAYLDNAMLVVGPVPADYAPLHPADDLARCQRYYELIVSGTANTHIATAQAGSAVAAFAPIIFRTPKAVTPTVTNSAHADFRLYAANTTLLTMTGFSASGISLLGCATTLAVASGLVAGDASVLLTATSNARISVEANA